MGEVITDSVDVLAPGRILCLSGVGRDGHASSIAPADVATQVVLRNNIILGSVNANKRHWYKAGQALARADHDWLSPLITRHETPEHYTDAL